VSIVGSPFTDGSGDYNTGSISVTVNGVSESAPFGGSDTPQTVASALATAFNSDSNSPVTASTTTGFGFVGFNTVLSLTSKTGSGSNLVISVGEETDNGPDPTELSFLALPSGALTGTTTVTIVGSGQGDDSDGCIEGDLYVTVNGITEYAGFSCDTFNTDVATALASAFNSDSGSPVTASVSGNIVTLTSKSGSSTALAVSVYALNTTGSQPGTPSFIPIVSGH
jgi:phage tail sheath gpL-like